jgi:hypothetical protein
MHKSRPAPTGVERRFDDSVVDETGGAASLLLDAAADVSRQSETLMSGVNEFLMVFRA